MEEVIVDKPAMKLIGLAAIVTLYDVHTIGRQSI